MTGTNSLAEQILDLKKKNRSIMGSAQGAGRELTKKEADEIVANQSTIVDLEEKKLRVEKSEKSLDDLVQGGRSDYDSDDDDEDGSPGVSRGRKAQYLTLTGERSRKAAERFATAIQKHGGVKAIGSGVVTGAAFNPEPLDSKKLPTSILDLLRVIPRQTPTWRGIRQTGFTNNATVVPSGAKKPTSELSIENIDGFVVVVAHLSEYMDTYMLEDNANLAAFIDRNLHWGLKDALEEQILNGTGTDDTYDGKPRKNIQGIMHTTGVQQQAATAEPIVTLRAASTKLETAGFASDVYVLNPVDWEAIETNRNASGNFDLGSALNLAERRVWGTRVVTSSRLDQGKALALDLSALNLDTDRLGIKTEGHIGDTGFEHNQIRFRAEGRFGLSIEQPEGIVAIDLAEAEDEG